MIVSSLRLALVGLFLFVVTSVSVEAAEYPQRWFGTAYITGTSTKVATCQPFGGSVVECQSQILAMLNDRGACPENPCWKVSSQSSTSMHSTIGATGVTITLINPVGAVLTTYDLVTDYKPDPSPPEDSVVFYSVQDMIVIATAFIVLCIGWSCGLKS